MQAVDHFLEAKGKSDASAANGADGLQDLVDTLHSLTSLRATLLARLSSGKPPSPAPEVRDQNHSKMQPSEDSLHCRPAQ